MRLFGYVLVKEADWLKAQAHLNDEKYTNKRLRMEMKKLRDYADELKKFFVEIENRETKTGNTGRAR